MSVDVFVHAAVNMGGWVNRQTHAYINRALFHLSSSQTEGVNSTPTPLYALGT